MKYKEITEDTFVGYAPNGDEIRAESLSMWAYNQLNASRDMYEALKELTKGYDPAESWGNGINKALQALKKAEGGK